MRKFNFVGKSILAMSSVALLTILLVGCSKNLTTSTDSIYVPTTADVTASVSLADLEAGRSIYINSCGRCHALYAINSVSASVIPGMASKSGLTATQTSQVTKFINLRK